MSFIIEQSELSERPFQKGEDEMVRLEVYPQTLFRKHPLKSFFTEDLKHIVSYRPTFHHSITR
jgi:hypothetical protein